MCNSDEKAARETIDQRPFMAIRGEKQKEWHWQAAEAEAKAKAKANTRSRQSQSRGRLAAGQRKGKRKANSLQMPYKDLQ